MSDPTEPLPAPAASPEPAAPVSSVPAAPGASKNRWITPTLALVAALAIGLVGGVLIGHTATASQAGSVTRQGGQGFTGGAGGPGGTAGGAAGNGTGGAAGGFGRGNFTAGTITSVDGSTITITEADGTTKKITTSASTKVTKTITSTVDALKAGETITVLGLGADGSGTATTITQGAIRQFGVRPGAATNG